MIITEEEFDKLTEKEKEERVTNWLRDYDDWAKLGAPMDIQLLTGLADKYNLYIPK